MTKNEADARREMESRLDEQRARLLAPWRERVVRPRRRYVRRGKGR